MRILALISMFSTAAGASGSEVPIDLEAFDRLGRFVFTGSRPEDGLQYAYLGEGGLVIGVNDQFTLSGRENKLRFDWAIQSEFNLHYGQFQVSQLYVSFTETDATPREMVLGEHYLGSVSKLGDFSRGSAEIDLSQYSGKAVYLWFWMASVAFPDDLDSHAYIYNARFVLSDQGHSGVALMGAIFALGAWRWRGRIR